MGPPSGNRWTPEEDRSLKTLVAKHGPRWKTVAHAMRTKTDSQCARRWENRLVPRKPRDWTAKEDLVLVAGHKLMGKRWKRIASRIGSRSADAARNRWASLVKRMPLLEKNHEYDAGLAQAEVSGQDGSVCTETESHSSQGVSTCHHDGGGGGTTPDTSTLTSRSPTARQARAAQPQRFEAAAALAPMTPPPRGSLLPRGATAVLAEDHPWPPVKTEAPIAAAVPLAAACKSEPITPRWRPDDGRVFSYAQASTAHEDKGNYERKYERHASVNAVFKSPFAVPALCADLGGWPSVAPLPHMPAVLPAEEVAGFDDVDWIPACISGGEAGLWRNEWHGPDPGLSMLPCAYW